MKLKVGDSAFYEKRFSIEEHLAHLKCINDQNPIHYSEEYAKSTVFKKPIIQGALAASLISGILGTSLPGKGAVYLGQKLSFIAPIYIAEKVKTVVTVIHIRKDKPIITLRTEVIKENGEIAIEGEAVVKVPAALIA